MAVATAPPTAVAPTELAAVAKRVAGQVAALLPPDGYIEIRALGCPGGTRSRVFAGGGNAEAVGAFAADCQAAGAHGVYWTPNPLAAANGSGKGGAATDKDIARRHWLLIDVDPVRPADTSATTTEREAAWRVAHDVRSTLEAYGFGGLVVCDSGNGWHVMVPVDLPNDEASRDAHKELLRQLQKRFGTDGAHVDVHTFNAARIWKLPGTMARKGEASAERKHRTARVVSEPPPDGTDLGQRRHAPANTRTLAALLKAWETQDAAQVPNDEAYARATLEKEVGIVATTRPGGRNHQLNTSAHNVGQLVGLKMLGRGEAESALLRGAIACELVESEAAAVIRRGLDAGIKNAASRAARLNGSPTTNGKHIGPAAAPAAGKTTEPEPWETPVPLTELPAVPGFPVDVFPPMVRTFVRELGAATDSPADAAAAMLLAFVGGAIGNSRWIQVKPGFEQPPLLFLASVAKPGRGKSPPFRELKRPFVEAEMRYRTEFVAQKKAYTDLADKTGTAQPTRRRCMTDDFTTEGLMRILADNGRGVLGARSELRGLITSMNQYKDGKGNDRQVMLQLFDAETIMIDRKGNVDGEPLHVHRAFCGIVGTIQPAVIESLRDDDGQATDDGFFDRFLVCYPDPLPFAGEAWMAVSESARQAYARVIEHCLSLEMPINDKGRRDPLFLRLSQDGMAAWRRHTTALAAEMNDPEFPEHLHGPWAKFKGYAARVALILHCLDEAFAEGLVGEIDGNDVDRAWKVIAFFKEHCKRVMCVMDADARLSKAKRVLRWVAACEDSTFSRRDIYRHLQSDSQFPRPESLDAPLTLLAGLHYVRELAPEHKQTGRRASQRYEINPGVRPGRKTDKTDKTPG